MLLNVIHMQGNHPSQNFFEVLGKFKIPRLMGINHNKTSSKAVKILKLIYSNRQYCNPSFN